MNNNNKIISIYDCFKYYQKIETLSGENALPCDYCKLTCSNSYMSSIYTPPEIFIIILEKSKISQIKLEFYEEINLSNFISVNNIGCIYRLFGVVSESEGISRNFIAY
jgi:ubiquitin C-terminal hydrolase